MSDKITSEQINAYISKEATDPLTTEQREVLIKKIFSYKAVEWDRNDLEKMSDYELCCTVAEAQHNWRILNI